MSALDSNLLVLVVYRLGTMLIGLAAVYMGYRLFLSGFFEHAGDLKATWGERGLVLKQAAPGTVFALLGVIAIVVSLVQGISITPTSSGTAIVAAPDSAEVAAWHEQQAAMAIAQKAVRGETLTDAERATFQRWVERTTRPFDVRIVPGSSSVLRPR